MEYIIRVTDGEAEREATYEHGVQGMRRAAVIVLEDASIGEILETLFSIQGPSLPQSIIVSEENIPEYYYRPIGELCDGKRSDVILGRPVAGRITARCCSMRKV